MINSYAQNGEDIIIQKFFIGRNPYDCTILDIGANDGVTLSNSRILIEQGWNACLVEPSPKAFTLLNKLYELRAGVYCYNYAIGAGSGTQTFYESSEHLGNGDIALLSTLNEYELKRWEGSGTEFKEIEVEVLSFADFLKISPIKKFHCISIDAEGVDFEILQQIDISALGCELLVIEWNSLTGLRGQIETYMAKFGFNIQGENAENLFFAKIPL